jgi:peptidoglycan/xylan/chitin deacetylase (PgdA/CDA1 family)
MGGVPPRSPVPRARALVAAVVVALVSAGCTRAGAGPTRLQVYVARAGRLAPVEVERGTTVADALRRARVVPRNGRLLAAVSHRPLGPNDRPARLRVGGRTVTEATVLTRSSTIEVTDGRDTVEGTRVVERSIPQGGLPKALQYVQFAGRPGTGRATVGARSGEVVDLRTTVAPQPAHRATGKVLALTFDDGPSPTYTRQVLAILKAKKVPAVFCEIGNLAEAHPELTAEVVAAGHQLCNHTEHHVEGLEREPRATVEAEIAGGREALEAAGGETPAYYRPPGGSLGPVIYEVAAAHDEPVLYWSIDPRDWKQPTAHDLLVAIVSQLQPGGIVLLHDGGGNRDQTIAALPAIIDYARALGYTFTVPITLRPQAR